MNVDLVFLHPGGVNTNGLQGPIFPIGLLPISHQMSHAGISNAIYNIMTDMVFEPNFSFEKVGPKILQFNPKIVMIDLHWFIHSYEAIELARVCKNCLCIQNVVLGGITATIFAAEIMRDFEFIDAIVRGDGELPTLKLAKKLLYNKGKMKDIPNIVYRNKKEIIFNKFSYFATTRILGKYSYLDFSNVLDKERNLLLINRDYVAEDDWIDKSFKRYTDEYGFRSWAIYTGRGCPFNCPFCGGSSSASFLSRGHKGVTLRPPQLVAADLMAIDEMSIVDSVYFPHSPLIIASKYHHKLLSVLEDKGKLNIGFIFEDVPFNLDFKITERYTKIFSVKKSSVRIYFADMESRQDMIMPSSDRLLDYIIKLIEMGLVVQVFPLLGLPFQNLKKTRDMMEFCLKAYNVGAIVHPYNAELHPGSLIHMHPEIFGINLELETFKSYYEYLRGKKDKAMTLGYQQQNQEITLEEQKQLFVNAFNHKYPLL